MNMNKCIPICSVLVLLGVVVTTSGFKCYVCEYATDGNGHSIGDPDCEGDTNLAKFAYDCPEEPMSTPHSINPKDKGVGRQKIADLMVSLFTPRDGKHLTPAVSPKAVYHHCVKGTAKRDDEYTVLRQCRPRSSPYENRCESDKEDGIKYRACVCNTELCNGAPALKLISVLPIVGVLAYLLS